VTEFRARIGRVRMKNGGADVRVLCRVDDTPDRRGEIVKHARKVASYAEPNNPLVGHVVIGFFKDGTASIGCYYHDDNCPVPRSLLPVWTEELVRRDLVTDPECHKIFDAKFEWREK
jgi:hypothetical protein